MSFVGVPPSVVRAADMKKAKKGGRYAEPWVSVQEGRERDSLPGSTVEIPQARRLPAWGFPYRKSDELKDRWFFEGEFLKCQGLFQPAPALRFFKKSDLQTSFRVRFRPG